MCVSVKDNRAGRIMGLSPVSDKTIISRQLGR